MTIRGQGNRDGLSDIANVDRGDTNVSQRHRIYSGLRESLFKREVILVKIVWTNDGVGKIKRLQCVLDRQFGREMRHVLELIYLENRVIHKMAELAALSQIEDD